MRTLTGQQLLTNVLRDIHEIDQYNDPDNDQLALALESANDLLDQLATEHQFIRAPSIHTFPFASGQGIYKLGAGAEWNAPVPERIERWSVIESPGLSGEREYQRTKPVDLSVWQAVDDKMQTGQYPSVLYAPSDRDENGHTTLRFWRIPTNYSARLYMFASVLREIDLETTYRLDDGYSRTIRKLLGPEVAPQFRREVTELMMIQAEKALKTLKRLNRRFPTESPRDSMFSFRTGRGSSGHDIREG